MFVTDDKIDALSTDIAENCWEVTSFSTVGQHKLGSKVHTQEVMVWGTNLGDTVNSFTGDAKSLVEALTDALQLIDTIVQTKGAQDHG